MEEAEGDGEGSIQNLTLTRAIPDAVGERGGGAERVFKKTSKRDGAKTLSLYKRSQELLWRRKRKSPYNALQVSAKMCTALHFIVFIQSRAG